jgi:hypothetical protein
LAQEGKTDFALNNPRMRTSGYLKYEFLDNESNNQPIVVVQDVGEKVFFNLGAGFLYQPK